MENSELILAIGSGMLGFGLGLLVYAVHRIRETRYARWRAKSDKRYAKLLARIDREEQTMKARVTSLTDLKEGYSNVA